MVLIETITNQYETILKNNLVGIYVHGSIAFGCFNEEKSDIDFIVVVKRQLNHLEREALIKALLETPSTKKGFEMSVVLEKNCQFFIYPTPYELHYSNTHKENYLNHFSEYCHQMQGFDKDLAAHFTVIKHKGICVYGKSINEVFGEVKEEFYLDSIHYDIEDGKEGIFLNPTYYVLNICRVLAYEKEKLVLSKKEGGMWGLRHLNEKEIIQKALDDYVLNQNANYSRSELEKFISYIGKEE